MVKAVQEVACAEVPRDAEGVDEAGYLGANPDVRAAGMDARTHFERHGHKEDRVQWVNAEAVDRLRQGKLDRLRFRRKPVSARQSGRALSFVTASLAEEFQIGDHPPVSANQYGPELMGEIRSHPERLYLDVGAGLRYSCLSNVVNTEIYDGISTDVVCIAEDLPFESAQFDSVICISVLEHTRRPWQAAAELVRVCKPGGRLMIDWPFLQGVHGYPNHFFNATPQGAISLFEESCEILSSKVNTNQHPIFALYWLLRTWRSGLPADLALDFDHLRVADFIGPAPDEQRALPYCCALTMQAQHVIGAGSTLLARKREGGQAESSSATRRTKASIMPRLIRRAARVVRSLVR